jgi:hypothetical protein
MAPSSLRAGRVRHHEYHCVRARPYRAAAVGAPLISEGAAWEAGSEVLVGAHVNPEGLETTYEIQVPLGQSRAGFPGR